MNSYCEWLNSAVVQVWSKHSRSVPDIGHSHFKPFTTPVHNYVPTYLVSLVKLTLYLMWREIGKGSLHDSYYLNLLHPFLKGSWPHTL